ncbi:MAG: substrate-binding domain-containing protein [Myxococcota bacterium]|nr:substrate-binding domain-containing protein [Myxococcota bacterium]
MNERSTTAPKRLTGAGPAPCIGFLVDELHDSRYQWQVLRGAAREANDRGANLLAFVGGPLPPPGGSSELNWIFDLAKPKNVDAIVVLSGSLGNAVGVDGLKGFCERYRSMPTCSIAIPLPEISSVCIENETGMRAAIEHLIHVHRFKRIAFVRGPASNEEAELRQRVYREVLELNGIPYVPELVVAGDFTQSSGREAITTLFGRRLSVGDVAAIVAANDGMALGVLEGLRGRGIKVPEQIAVVGFDDIEEARFALPPLTTVSQPLFDQGREAVRIVLEQLRSPTNSAEQAMRHTDLIVRRSCGCLPGSASSKKSSNPPGSTLGFDSALLRRRQHILADMARAARGQLGPAGPQWDARLINAVAEQVRGESPDAFVRTYDEILRRMVATGADLAACNDVISALRGRLVRCINDVKRRTQAEDFFHEARIMTTNALEGVQVGRRVRSWNEALAMMQSGTAIISTRDMEELAAAVHQNLPNAGILRCFVVRLWRRPDGSEVARLVLAEKPDARKLDPSLTTVYSGVDVFREAVLLGTDVHSFAIFPAVFRNGERGAVILELGFIEAQGYEMMRQVFTAALARMDGERIDPVS